MLGFVGFVVRKPDGDLIDPVILRLARLAEVRVEKREVYPAFVQGASIPYAVIACLSQ